MDPLSRPVTRARSVATGYRAVWARRDEEMFQVRSRVAVGAIELIRPNTPFRGRGQRVDVRECSDTLRTESDRRRTILLAGVGTAAALLSESCGHPDTTTPAAGPTPTHPHLLAGARALTGHSGDVTFVAFSPNGKILASGSADKTIRLWKVATGTRIATLRGHQEVIGSVAFSPDGKTLADSANHTVLLWPIQ